MMVYSVGSNLFDHIIVYSVDANLFARIMVYSVGSNLFDHIIVYSVGANLFAHITAMSRDNLLKGRVSLAYHAYHVTICTHNRALLFADFTDGRLVVAEMRKLHEEGIVNSLAWVIMPDHLHWLFQLGEKMTLSEAMKHFKARSAQALNRHHGQHGVIWQKGYYDHALRCEEDIQAVARYIVANPLRAGLVKKMGEYPLWDAIWIRGE